MRTESGYHRLQTEDGIIVARAPKKLLRGERVNTTAVVIGDRVRAVVAEDGTGSIEEILPRRNQLVRGAAGESRFLDVIAANLDLFLAVHSLREPELNTARIDRFLLMAQIAGIPAMVVLNKLDLAGDMDLDEIEAPYRQAGYPVILTSASTGQGIERMREALSGGISALAGPSGVGKSTLLNRMQPGLRLRTGEISEATGKGRHTTTTAELLLLDLGGYVADTPGLRELAIPEIEYEDLGYLFPDFHPYLGACRFANCTHREEAGCAVRAAVEAGKISGDRYRSFRHIHQDLEEKEKY
ncbi:MAG: ribosome small subunit-dependent GTPase A [Chloroflexota bacterium]